MVTTFSVTLDLYRGAVYAPFARQHVRVLVQGDPHDIADTFVRDATEVFEQVAVVAEPTEGRQADAKRWQ